MKNNIGKVLLVSLIILLIFTANIQAINLQKWFTEEGMRLYIIKERHTEGLYRSVRPSEEEMNSRVHLRKEFAYKQNYVCNIVHPRRVWKDILVITAVESWFVNWKSLDNGKSFGTGSMQWSTCKWLAKNVYNWNWNKEKRLLASSDKLQAKYQVGYYYWLLNHYDGDRHRAIIGYNKHQVDSDRRWENYFFQVYGRLKYYETIWNEMRD